MLYLVPDYTVDGITVLHRNMYAGFWTIRNYGTSLSSDAGTIFITKEEWEILVDLLVE
jgi:hypothetical protein